MAEGQRFIPIIIKLSGDKEAVAGAERIADAYKEADERAVADAIKANEQIRREFGITSDIIQRTRRETAESSAVTAQRAAQEATGRRAAYPAGYAAPSSFTDFENQEKRVTSAKKAADEVKTIQAETARQAAAQAKLRTFAAEELDKVETKLAKHSADEFIKSDLLKTKSFSSFASSAISTATAVIGVVTIITAVITTAVVALFDLVKSTAAATEQLSNFSKENNFSVTTLSGLKAIGEGVNVTIESINKALTNYDKNMELAASGNKRMSITFQKLHLDTTDNEKSLRQIFQILAKMPEGFQQTALAQKLFGEGGAEVLKIIKATNGDIDEAIKKYSALGLVISEEGVNKARQFNNEYTHLQQAISGASREFAEEVMPEMTGALSDINKGFNNNKSVIHQWGKEVADIIHGLRIVAESELGSVVGAIVKLTFTTITAIAQLLGFLGRTEGERFYQDVPSYLPPAEELFNKKGKQRPYDIPSGRGGGGEDKARQEQIRQLEEQTKDVERVYKNETEALKRQFDLQIISLQEFTDKSTEAELVRYTKKQEILFKEIALAKTASERQKYFRESEQSLDDKNKNVQALNDERDKKEIDDLRKQRESLLKLGEEYDARAIANIRAMVDAQVITSEQGETRIAEIQREAYHRRWDALIADREEIIARAGGIEANANQQELAEVNRHLKELEEAEKTAGQERERRIFIERKKSLDNLRAYQQQVRNLDIDNQLKAIDVRRSEIEQAGRLGMMTPRTVRRMLDSQDELAEIQRARKAKLDILQEQSQLQRQTAETDRIFKERLELAEVEHQDRMREIRMRPLEEYVQRVMEISQSVAQVFGSAFDAIFDKSKSFWRELSDGFKQLFLNIVRSWIESGVARALQSLMLPVTPGWGGGQITGSGGGRGGGIFGTILGGISGLFNRGGAATASSPSGVGGAAAGDYISNLLSGLTSSAHGGGISVPQTVEEMAQHDATARLVSQMGSTGVNAGMSTLMGGGLSFSGLGASLGPMLPLMGLGLGLGLGGGGGLSGILGGAGGLLAGGIGAAFLAPGLFGVVPGAMTVAGSSSAAFMSGLYGFLTNPFTIGAAAALLIGAYLMNRNKQRRQNEEKRATLNSDTYTAIIQVLNATRRGDLTLTEAQSQWNQIKTNYFNGIASFDGKTKRIATDVWNKEFEPTYWPLIQQAAKDAEDANAINERLVPEFRDGGATWRRFADGGALQLFRGRVPGVYDRRDDKVIRVSGDEVVLNPAQWMPLVPALKRLQVPGFADGGSVSNNTPSLPGLMPNLVVNVNLSKSDVSEVVVETMDGPQGRKIVKRHTFSLKLNQEG